MCEAHNLVQYNNNKESGRSQQEEKKKKENAFIFMLKCMFTTERKKRSATDEITNWSRIEHRAASYTMHALSLTNG